MRFSKAFFALFFLASCTTRPLSDQELAFVQTTVPGLETESIALTKGALTGRWIRSRPPRPQRACRERIYPPETGDKIPIATAAFVVEEEVFYSRRFYRGDILPGYPNQLPLSEAMLFAHEMTHVWQWQNRDITGYHPLRAVREQADPDPYLFDLEPPRDFLEYGFEQQAALVEEFVCCRALDPEGARTAMLYKLLRPYFPGLARQSSVVDVSLPWPDAPVQDICA